MDMKFLRGGCRSALQGKRRAALLSLYLFVTANVLEAKILGLKATLNLRKLFRRGLKKRA